MTTVRMSWSTFVKGKKSMKAKGDRYEKRVTAVSAKGDEKSI